MITIALEAAKAASLHKIHEDDFFSELGESSDFDQRCNGIDNNLTSKRREVKGLCIKLIRNLDKLSQGGESERTNYCKYIRYCLYEQIREIHANKSAKLADVIFFNKLILAWTVIKIAKLSNKYNSENIKDVKLNELKNRIFSYIYFKNLEKIKKVSTYENRTDCNNYLTYPEGFKPVHDGYKDKHCVWLIVSSSNGTNYFPCKDRYVMMPCNIELEKCKAINLKTNIIFSGITKFVKFIKNIGYQIFSQYSDYNKCIKCKRIEGYSNHKYTEFIGFNKFNRSSRSRKVNTSSCCKRRTWKIFELPNARKFWVFSSHSIII
ncbi:CYIR protein [Plasmodium cynomolgi strain B]|uniref:CYIR protein n=1 Tax=Plasmodium cynomolgi (strain B) TaxID=1120755 RepID=K6UZX9_PLACD|nr:CYIR protein [Plasmodium cynomolgi strain B]GAB69549.1 CYIR protein [Plasmodium cynomolgi strain B]